MKTFKRKLTLPFCFVIILVSFANVDGQKKICRKPNGVSGQMVQEDKENPCNLQKCVPMSKKRGIWVKGFQNLKKCCVQNGTLYEADSIIEEQTIGCEKRTVNCKMSSEPESETFPSVVFETDNSKCTEGLIKDLMQKVSNMSVEMQAASNHLNDSISMGMVQVVNRIEENALKIHQNQSADQMIMMNAIIDKIENISCCGPPEPSTPGPSTLPPTPTWGTSPTPSSTVSETTTTTTSGGSVCNCGIPNRPNRIFGGSETDPNEYPWVVYLDIGRTFLCGGSIISNQHVLTAAHCVDGDVTASDLRVFVGTHDRTRPAKIVDVSSININPSWTGSLTRGSDSAVLTLAESVPFSDTVRPLCMPVDPSRSFVGQMAVASGWGLDDNGGIPSRLRDVNVEIISNDQCRRTWPSVNDDFHLCSTGETNGTFGTRGGDSGTLVFLEENGRYTGVGINSFNSDPDVFAKVTPDVKEWIQTIAQTQDSDCSSTKPITKPTTKTTTTTEGPSPSLNKTIELVGGANRKEGNVLLYGKPICDDGWGDNDAKVACRMLGFNTSSTAVRAMSTFGPVETNFSMYGPRCTGSELSLFDCDDYYYRDCRANEGAGVICEYEPPTDTIIELVGGNTTSGNVLLDGRPICGFGWGDYDAKVICRMLGLDTLVAKATTRNNFGDFGRDYILAYVGCRGSEEHIGQCSQGPGTTCGYGVGAGVMCIPPGPTSNIPVELVDGSDNTEGTVKIYGQPIIDRFWDNKDASVICRMLGFNPSASVALTASSFGYPDIANYNRTNVRCTGSEKSIYDCPSSPPTSFYGYLAAGVTCDYSPPSNTTVELVGGNNTKEGNVLLNGSPICDDYWDTMDAKVICRMLGFDPTNSVATVRSAFGEVSSVFSLDDVRCEGTEANILLCTRAESENCGASEGAGVVCESTARSLASLEDDENTNQDDEEAAKKMALEDDQYNEVMAQD